MPEARGYPLVGVAPTVALNPLRALSRIASQHPGELVSLRLGPMRAFLVTHPPHVEHVMHTRWRNYGKRGPMWQALRRLLGNGLIASEGQTWVSSRRTLQPLFHHRHLVALTERMSSTIRRILDELAERTHQGRPVELFQEMNVLTQSVILESMFEVSISRPEAEHLEALLSRALKETNLRMFLPFIPEDFPVLGAQRLRRAVAQIDESLQGLTERWEQAQGQERTSLLALLRQAADPETGRGMPPQQVRDEVLTLWTAGNETTATALTWTWYLLSLHPEVEARLRAEVESVLGQRVPTHADLEHLRYCRQVLLESMRLYPPAWIIPRMSVEEDTVDGYAMPADSLVLISPYITHRSPLLWEQPERFDPERFSRERSDGRHAYAYLPFGGGPRRCLGEHFAMAEAQLAVAMMTQRFRLKLVPGQRVEARSAAALRPSGPVQVTLQPV